MMPANVTSSFVGIVIKRAAATTKEAEKGSARTWERKKNKEIDS